MNGFFRRILPGLLVLLALLQPVPARAYTPTGSETGVVSAEFSRGGLYLTIVKHEPQGLMLISAGIEYCDGSVNEDRYNNLYHILIGQEFTYIAEKPMRKARLSFTRPFNDDFSYENPIQVIRIERGCAPVSPPARLYCGQASIPAVVHRGSALPLTFSAPPSVHRAGLKIPGVDHLVYAQRVRGDLTYHWERTMSYGYRHRRWVATLPSFKIPVGAYEDVELVVQDGHGRQAKCSVGSLTVLP